MKNYRFKEADTVRYVKALVDAILHEMPIGLTELDRLYFDGIKDKNSKLILKVFRDLYQNPSNQPNNKQIADAVYEELISTGYSKRDAAKFCDGMENLVGRKRQPDVMLVSEAIEHLRVDVTTVTNTMSDESTSNVMVYDALLDLCKSSGEQILAYYQREIVRLFNFTHSVVLQGGKVFIYEKKVNHKQNIHYEFSSYNDRKTLYKNLVFSYSNRDKTETGNCFDVWMKSHERETYQGVIFDPSCKTNSSYLNLWNGFSVEPIPGDDLLGPIMWHLKNIICDGNEEYFRYLLAWMAHIFQKPEEKTGVCVVLKSDSKGTGKSTVAVLLESLIKENSVRIQDSQHFLGNFNILLANKLFVMIEESFWSGSPRDAAKLKTLITERTIVVEAKGKDAIQFDSYHRFMMCTNSEWAVPQTRDERRFFVLEVSDQKKQDEDYFNELYESMNSTEVLGQFFNFLNNYDISPYNLYKAPKTEATYQQLLESLKSEETWLMGLLENERLEGNLRSYDLEQDRIIPKQEFFASYISFCKQMGVIGFSRCNAIQLGKFLKKIIDVKDGGKITVAGRRHNCYELLSVKEMKSMFNDYYRCF